MHLLGEMLPGFSRDTPQSQTDLPTLEAIGHRAQNANNTLMHGFAAIGRVLMNAGLNADGRVDPSHLARLGDLITHVAVEAEGMQELDWTIRETLESHAATIAADAGTVVT